MGIPHGPGAHKASPKKFNPEEVPIKGMSQNQPGFSSFEDTFKSVKKQDSMSSSKRPADRVQSQDARPEAEPRQAEAPDADFDEQPIPAAQRKVLPPVDSNVVDVDAIEIKPKQQLTFEEMLEKELSEKQPKAQELPPDDDRVIRKKPKKEFLKRTKRFEPPKGKAVHSCVEEKKSTKKYKYYADHFASDK